MYVRFCSRRREAEELAVLFRCQVFVWTAVAFARRLPLVVQPRVSALLEDTVVFHDVFFHKCGAGRID